MLSWSHYINDCQFFEAVEDATFSVKVVLIRSTSQDEFSHNCCLCETALVGWWVDELEPQKTNELK